MDVLIEMICSLVSVITLMDKFKMQCELSAKRLSWFNIYRKCKHRNDSSNLSNDEEEICNNRFLSKCINISHKKIWNCIRGCKIICDWSEYIGGSSQTRLTLIAH